jgi:integrase
MAERRKDVKGRILRDGEDQLQDGRYRYRYLDSQEKRQAVYSWKLVPTDKTPLGKRDDLSLREKIKQINQDLNDGLRSTNRTLNEQFELYMRSKFELKQSSRSDYEYAYKQYIRDGIGKKKISSIKYSDIKNFYIYLAREKGLSLNTVGVIHVILHPVFDLAVRDGYLRNNPSDGVMAEVRKLYNAERPKRHALTIEEQTAFINFIANSNTYRYCLPLFTVFLGTGCRVGEIIGLRWQDCDFNKGVISINHNLVYKRQSNGRFEMHITTPKTSSGCRIIPMLNEVKEALLQERKQQMAHHNVEILIDGYGGFVFTNRVGNIYTPASINALIKRIYTAYNKKEKKLAMKEHREPNLIRHFSVHNLRHTFCTRFCENETNIKVIQEIMGHANIATTMDVYAEATEQKKKESFKNLQGKIKIY